MNLKPKEIQDKLEKAMHSNSSEEEILHEARMIMYRFLSEVERISDEEGILRKDLAKAIGTSPSYITQLFRGTKILNLITLAKLQQALKVRFVIRASEISLVSDFSEEKMWTDEEMAVILKKFKTKDGVWVHKSFKKETPASYDNKPNWSGDFYSFDGNSILKTG